MPYRCVATSVAGFIQQLAVGYISHGYYFYVSGQIPEHKNPANTDRKILGQYDIALTKWARSRRKRLGQASVQYLRHDCFFVLVATPGAHPFFAAECGQIHDFRRRTLHFHGYSIGCRRARGGGRWHASVRLQRAVFRELKARFKAMAVYCPVEVLCREFQAIPYEPYAPVRDQLRVLFRAVNRHRHAAGLEPVPREALRLKRVPVRPFVEDQVGDVETTDGFLVRKCPGTAFEGKK